MKAQSFFRDLFREFPAMFITWSGLLILQGVFAGAALLSIAPIIDTILHPDMEQVSLLTSRFVKLTTQLHLPTSTTTFVLIFLSFILLKNMFFVFARYAILKIKYALAKSITKATFEDIFRARWLFFSQSAQGAILNTFTREIVTVVEALGQMSFLLASLIHLIIYIAVPMYVAWEITVTCFVLAVVFAIPFIFLHKINYRLGQQSTSTANQMMAVLKENLDAAKVILGFGNQHQNIQRYLSAFDENRKVTIKSEVLNMVPPYIYEPLGILALIIALLTAKTFSIVITDVIIVVWGLKNAIPYIGQLVNRRNSVVGLMPSYEQVLRFRNQAQQLEQTCGDKRFEKINKSISLKQVSFAYPERKNALTDIDLEIPKGKMTAIVGESGGGKSTLIDILMGFNFPDKGEVAIDGTPLEKFDIDSYRNRIGYVPQDAILFNMSVRENLLWANNSATEQEIWEACQLANAEEYIRKLPDQLETLIGDRGVRLSGGQCQRLALARAILLKPELLILDEATSALDTKSERLIQQAIENIAKNTTTVIVAHRLSTIIHAHRIYVIKDGSIVEQGSYADLIQNDGLFHKMVQLQSLKKSA